MRATKAVFIGTTALIALLLAQSDPPQLVLYSAVLIYMMVCLSLVVLTGWAGQVSLGHFSFVALGALFFISMALLIDLKLRFIKLYRTILYLPAVTSLVAIGIVWVWLFDPQYGLINQLLRAPV